MRQLWNYLAMRARILLGFATFVKVERRISLGKSATSLFYPSNPQGSSNIATYLIQAAFRLRLSGHRARREM